MKSFMWRKLGFADLSTYLQNTSLYISKSPYMLLLLSRFSRVRLCVTPQMAGHQAPLTWDSPGKNTGVSCHFLLHPIYTHTHLYSIYIYIHMHTYIHIHMHMYAYIYTHIHIYTCIYTYTYNIYILYILYITYMHIYIYTHIYIHIYVYMYMCIYVYTHIHIYIYNTAVKAYTHTAHTVMKEWKNKWKSKKKLLPVGEENKWGEETVVKVKSL